MAYRSKDTTFVTLHIGRGKTGTTGIQTFLSRNRDALARQGIGYIRAGDEKVGTGHQAFARSLLSEIPSWMETNERMRTIQHEMRLEIEQSPVNHFLVSSENLTMVDPDRVRVFFEELLGDVCFKIIFFARSQDELAESQYNQSVKWSGETNDFYQYIDECDIEEVEYDILLEPWSEVFGQDSIVARIYDAASDSVVPDFLSCLPFNANGSDIMWPPQFQNQSVGYATTEIFRLLNSQGFHGRRGLYSKIKKLMKPHDSPPLFFNSSQARAFRERFADSNRRFSTKFLGKELADLGGRRYSDTERDALIAERGNNIR